MLDNAATSPSLRRISRPLVGSRPSQSTCHRLDYAGDPKSIGLTYAEMAALVGVQIVTPRVLAGGTYPVSVAVTTPGGAEARAIIFGSWPSHTTAGAMCQHDQNVVGGAVRT